MKIDTNVCFTGHRPDMIGGHNETNPLNVAIKSRLAEVVRECYSEGFRRFISGMAEGVDTWAAEAVIAAREELPDVRLIAAVPFVTQTAGGWSLDARDRWEGILRAADHVWVTTMDGGERWNAEELITEARKRIRERDLDRNTTPSFRIRNKWMVDRSALVVAVWNGQPSGTGYTVKYAEECSRRVLLIEASR